MNNKTIYIKPSMSFLNFLFEDIIRTSDVCPGDGDTLKKGFGGTIDGEESDSTGEPDTTTYSIGKL